VEKATICSWKQPQSIINQHLNEIKNKTILTASKIIMIYTDKWKLISEKLSYAKKEAITN
jgi:hypothetical protein